MEVVWTLVADALKGVVGALFQRRGRRGERREKLQPLINRLTIRLSESCDTVDDWWARQWELAYDDYGQFPIPDRLDELTEKAAAISVGAGRAARSLVRTFRTFADDMEHQHEIAERQALELVHDQPIAPEEGIDHFMLRENRRYHLWAENLYALDDAIAGLARELVKLADGDAAEALRRIAGRGTSAELGRQTFNAIVAGYERDGRVAGRWFRWRTRRKADHAARQVVASRKADR